MIRVTNQLTIKLDNESRIQNEVNTERDVSKWKLSRDRGQVSDVESILNPIL